ncbi:hypothetical protein HYU14_01940 [Candidatus Woesearchaeota archaeon]|nr:hypothetical protein [Candidatus Woesearchaeota archaeon]
MSGQQVGQVISEIRPNCFRREYTGLDGNQVNSDCSSVCPSTKGEWSQAAESGNHPHDGRKPNRLIGAIGNNGSTNCGKEEIIFSFPHMGHYSALVKGVFDSEKTPHFRVVLPPVTTKRTIQIGSQLAEAEMCLPYKITLGNLVESIESNKANRVSMFDSCGDCRLKIYNILHQKTLERNKYPASFFPLRFRRIVKDLKAINPEWKTLQIFRIVFKTARAIWDFDKKEFERYASQKNDGRPKIGFTGEIYTILDERANMDIFKKFRSHGAWVHNAVTLSQFVFKRILGKKYLRNLTRLKRKDLDYHLIEECENESYHYFPRHEIGGHARESIIFALYFAKKKYDLIVHLYPFPCMPEVTVAKFLDHLSQDYRIPLIHLMFDANFGEANLDTRIEASVNMINLRKKFLAAREKDKEITIAHAFLQSGEYPMKQGCYLGIDVGSVSTKAAIINEKLEVINTVYLETKSDPISAMRECIVELKKKVGGSGISIEGVGTTGSGRKLAGILLGADTVTDEITCQTLGCLLSEPKTRTIIEIGGQDSKYIEVDEMGIPVFFNMNNICSAGTGSFFSGTSRRLGIPVEQFGKIATCCSDEVLIAGRCGVFAESDLISKQQAGISKNALIKGLCMSMPRNFLANVAKGRDCIEPIVFSGGVASNEGVVMGFERALKRKVKVMPHNKVSGCIGAAMVAMAKIAREKSTSSFFGFKVADFDYQQKLFRCNDCPNNCEVSVVTKDGKSVKAVFGSRCGKWESLINKEIPPEVAQSGEWHPMLAR